MNDLPITPLSPEEQQRLMGQMYLLMAKQVKSYHKHHHMGENSSVPVELAQELMASVEYTMELTGGLLAVRDGETALQIGQEILKEKADEAQKWLDLVYATAPAWQTECRWEALACLRHYIAGYDALHLAHKGPDDLFYPILIPEPGNLRGMDICLFYLQILWLENQFLAGFLDDDLELLWNRLPADALNQCEQVLLNGLGKLMLPHSNGCLFFTAEERAALRQKLVPQSPQRLHDTVLTAAQAMAADLNLPEDFICTASRQILPRLETALRYDNLAAIFL